MNVIDLEKLFWAISKDKPPFMTAKEAAAICNANIKPFCMFSVCDSKAEKVKGDIALKDILTAARVGFALGALTVHEREGDDELLIMLDEYIIVHGSTNSE